MQSNTELIVVSLCVGLTGEEALHAVTVGHFQETPAGIRGQGGVSSVGQQDPHHIQVIVLHSVVDGSKHQEQGLEVHNVFFKLILQ